MTHVYCRPLRLHDEEDRSRFVEAAEKCNKGFPKGVFSLPSTTIMVAEKDGRPVMYQPFYIALILGSLVPVDGSSDTELASAQHQLTGAAYTKVHEQGLGDILMFSDTEETKAFAERHGYQAMHSAYRFEVR